MKKAAKATLFFHSVLLHEPIDTAVVGGKALFAGIEGMAFRAGIDSDFFQNRTGFEGVATGDTRDFATVIVRMDAFFHNTVSFLPTTNE